MPKKPLNKIKRKILSAAARMREAYQHWHRAAESYNDPEQFRIYLNSCIQALRNVTFVLQKQKKEIPDFDTWYGNWQEFLKKDLIMSWCISARNQIVKRGDLETYSIARASYLASYLKPSQKDFEVNPFSKTEDISKEIAELLPEKLRESGYLKVERRWVADSLPKYELLEALAYAFSVLAKLLLDTDAQKGPPLDAAVSNKIFIIDRGAFPARMSSFSQYRTIWLKFPALEIEYYLTRDLPFNEVSKEDFVQHYGEIADPQGNNGDRSILLRLATRYKEQAKIMLSVDGYLLTVAILLGEDNFSHIIPLQFEDNVQKYAIMELVAQEVERRRATGIVVVGEIWLAAFDPKKPFKRAVECSDKIEAIEVAAASKSGEEFNFLIPFSKDGDKIIFKEETYSETPSNFLIPVKNIWKN